MGTEPRGSTSSIVLDAANQCVRRNGQSIPLTPKAFAVLRRLMEQPGQLVTKEALLDTVWPGTYVSDAALKVCIRRLRQALGDLSHPPQYIETVHWRGYRLLIPIQTAPPPVASSQHSVVSRAEDTQHATRNTQHSALPTPNTQHLTPSLVGRDAELQQLHGLLAKTRSGERHTVFITGASGMGKTALVESFLLGARGLSSPAPSTQHPAPSLWIAQGQCVEHYGAGEPYLPVLEALNRACRAPGREPLVAALRIYAPLWLAQLPSLLSPAERQQLRQETQGSSRERMLREIAEALEAFTEEFTFILVLEDLHWSDPATLDLLSFLARRVEPARLLLLGVYRPEELPQGGHPLKNIKYELQTHHRCDEFVIPSFSLTLISKYLHERFSEHTFPPAFASLLHQRTGGNPLFLVNVLEHLIKRGFITHHEQGWRLTGALEDIATETPESIHQIIAAQIDRLTTEEKRVLEAASVAGMDFSAAAVAAGLAAEPVEVEACCEELARHGQFLRRQGPEEWPDGTVATHYEFLHSLYRQVWYERVTAARRVQLHQRIGERGEQAYQDQVQAIAAELAVHFEQGRDIPRAIRYRQYAAENALHRCGYHEAITHLTKGLELLSTQSASRANLEQGIRLYNELGAARIAALGYAAPAVEEAYTRARSLCERIAAKAESAPALRGLWAFYLTKGEFQPAHALATQLFQVAQQEQRDDLQLEAERALGQTCYFLGELHGACSHFERALALYDRERHAVHSFRYGQDPSVACLSQYARTLILLGHAERALARIDAALRLAHEVEHPYSLALAQHHATIVHLARRDWRRAAELVRTTLLLSTEHEFPYWLSSTQVLDGWLLTQQGQLEEGIARMLQGLTSYKATGAELYRPSFLVLLAEAYGRAGQPEKGLTHLTEALATAQKNGGHCHHAEMLRLRGELTLQRAEIGGWGPGISPPSPQAPSFQSRVPGEAAHEAKQCFLQAIEVARRQDAKFLELRAVTSLCRLWRQHKKLTPARRQLAEIVGWFTEGFDLPDWQEAKSLLDELG